MKAATAVSPIAIYIDTANNDGLFHAYANGILDAASCTTTANCCGEITHAVTLVGWGVRSSDSMEYWIVKNSWTHGWGENGYIRVENTGNDDDGVLCINSSPMQATTQLM